uniref:Uncharacterized protein n=1 Tax=Brassica oleracea var. oleracea TaxID=109376 RepID=A0A0D3BJS3_BRAOL
MSPIPQFLFWASHAASTLQITVLGPAAGGVRDTQGRPVFAGSSLGKDPVGQLSCSRVRRQAEANYPFCHQMRYWVLDLVPSPEFQQGEDTGTSHVNLDFSSEMPTNIANMMGVRTAIRDPHTHQQLKADLVEHLWSRFGCY